ncbi:hypothetical protein [Pedobacter suwonensis]|uniref:hypothetical protein n=1 Tax=Pedobacter suwonensis TaxID=332999 RepID=UPI0025D0EF4F|nr:hypothetical protein [uncultured Pedobacter sp.]
MKKYFIAIAFFGIIHVAKSQDTKPAESFEKIISHNNLMLDQPEGFVKTEPIKNSAMLYEYAVIDTSKHIEIRYAIRSLTERVKEYKKWLETKKEGEIRINPNTMLSATLMAIAMNIAGGSNKPPSIQQFPDPAVKKDFNADAGFFTIVTPTKNFGKDYKFCMVVAIHKEDIADAYTFILTDEMENLKKYITPTIFNALRFK